MGNGHRPDSAITDAEDWGDLLDEVEDAPVSPRPAGVSTAIRPREDAAAPKPPPLPPLPPPVPRAASVGTGSVGSFPPSSTPLGGRMPPSVPPVPQRASSAPPLPPREPRSNTQMYGLSPVPPPPVEGANGVSRPPPLPLSPSMAPPAVAVSPLAPPSAEAQRTLMGGLPLRPSVPPMERGALSVNDVWSDEDAELTFDANKGPALPAWAHGSTTEFEPNDDIVKAIGADSQPPVAMASSEGGGFVHFGNDPDDYQFDPLGVDIPGGAGRALAPSPVPDLRWDEVTPTGPREEIAAAIAASRDPKFTSSVPVSQLAELLKGPEDEQVARTRASTPPPKGDVWTDAHSRPTPPAPVMITPEAQGSAHERPTARAPADAVDLASLAVAESVMPPREDARMAMRERLAVEDFSGALAVADKLLEIDRADGEARRVAMRCREELRTIYAQRIGALNQIPTTLLAASELKWLALDHRAGFVLSLIDGMSSIEDIIDVSTMPSLEVLRTIHNLLSQNVISLRRPRR